MAMFLAAEVVDDLRCRPAGLRVPHVMGELQVADSEPSLFCRGVDRRYLGLAPGSPGQR